MEILLYPLAFLLLLGVIVVFHEFGHFIVARRSLACMSSDFLWGLESPYCVGRTNTEPSSY